VSSPRRKMQDSFLELSASIADGAAATPSSPSSFRSELESNTRIAMQEKDDGTRGPVDGPSSPSRFTSGIVSEMRHQDRAQAVSRILDDSLKLVSASTAAGNGFAAPLNEWEVQSPEQILEDVKKSVYSRKPWRQQPDDSLLEQRVRCHDWTPIPLPDNRVRLHEEQLSVRARCQLLNMDLPPPEAPEIVRKPKAKGINKVPNPWYLPAKKWYSLQEHLRSLEDRGCNFPYANEVYNLNGESDTLENSDPQRFAQLPKDTFGTVEAYKKYMNGARLPHFLL